MAQCESDTKVRRHIMRFARPILIGVSSSALAAFVLLGGVASAVEEPPHRVQRAMEILRSGTIRVSPWRK